MKRKMWILFLVGIFFICSTSLAPNVLSCNLVEKEIKVFILDNGFFECDANWMVAQTVVGTSQNKNPRTKWIKIPTYAVLVVHPEGNLLFDLGTHPDANEKLPGVAEFFPYSYEPNQLFESQLKLAGVKDIWVKASGNTHARSNLIYAVFQALKNFNRTKGEL